jgi:spore germination protein KA
LDTNLNIIKQEFNIPRNKDVIIREFRIAKQTKAVLVFINGMVDKTMINDIVLRQLMNNENFNELCENSIIDYIKEDVLAINQILKTADYNEIVGQLLNGFTTLFVDGCEEALLIECIKFEKRNVEKPQTEMIITGPHEGFTENLRTNLTLLRRIIRNKNLVTEMTKVGKTNSINCAIIYMSKIANPRIVSEVKRRMENLNVDTISGNGMLSQLIEDSPYSIIPQILSTERPDRTASLIMAGKVAIIADGTPSANVVPITFYHMFHTSEDTEMKWQYGTFLRFIRMFGLLESVLLPGVYLALNMYRQELIPTELLSAIAESRERVPFPLIFELIAMELSFELIREAGLRVPGIIGNTLGIIGALILGQAAVGANLVSPILIIVIAFTGLGNFSMPNFQLAMGLRIIRFVFIILGAIAGFYGISIGVFIMSGLLCNMKSFGVPFLSPVAPKLRKGKDLILRHPIWKDEFRPDMIDPQNLRKQGKNSRGWVKKSKGGNKQ